MNATRSIPPNSDALTRQPRALARNRRMLIAGVITILPSAAIMPSLIGEAKSPAMLAAVDEMATATRVVASENERAVELVSAKSIVVDAKPQAKAIGNSGATASDQRESAVRTASGVPIAVDSTDEVRYFNGRPVRAVRTITMLVTAYSPDARSCGESADGITASGYSVWTNGMKMVAADTGILPFGTLVSVPGYDEESLVPVLDRGGAIKGNRLDVLYPTHERAVQWGAQRLEVTVWEYADELPGDFVIAHR